MLKDASVWRQKFWKQENRWHLAVAVFVSDSPADLATRENVIAKIAKAIYEELSRR